LAPFYWLSPDIRTLMALQALALGLGAVPVYLLARAAFSSPFAGLALAAAYLLHPGTSYLSADVSGEVFRMDTFGLPFTLFALYYLTQWIPASPYPGTPASVRAWPAVVFAALAVLCREEYALLLASVGVWLVFRRRWRAGALCVLVGLVWLVVMLGVLMPRFCGEPSIGLAHLESTRKSYAAIESPGGAGRVWFLVALLLPVGFLPLCHLSRLAICLPVLVLHLMNAHPQVHSILWHYHAPLMPFLYFAAPGGVRWLSKRVGDRFPRAAGNLTSALVAFAFTAALLSNVLFSRSVLSAAFHHRVPPYRQVSLADARVRLQALADLKQLIPQDASVCATEFLANHFTHFRRIRLFPDGRRDADYIVVDLHDRWLGDHVRLVHEMKTDPAFELLAEREDLCLFRRN
jgi:uncharacterized membrane protein